MYERICRILNEKGLRPSTVEKELGWGNACIKVWQKSSPSVNKIVALAEYLNVSVSYLITGKYDDNSLSEKESHLLDIYKDLSEKNQARLMERAEALLEAEQD